MLIPIFLLIIGIGAVYAGSKTLKHHKRIASWPIATNGKLISKQIIRRKLVSGSRNANYIISVQYEFLVNGKKYSGNRYYGIELIGSEKAMMTKHAEKLMETINDPLSVYYNPENPIESFLVKDHPWFMYFSLIVGILMLLGSLIGFLTL